VASVIAKTLSARRCCSAFLLIRCRAIAPVAVLPGETPALQFPSRLFDEKSSQRTGRRCCVESFGQSDFARFGSYFDGFECLRQLRQERCLA
jgi:hypothetical protein